MNQIRFILIALLLIVLINLFELLVHKIHRKSSITECLIIIFCLMPIYQHQIDYIDLACLNGNATDFILILLVGITSLITIILILGKGDTNV